MLTVVDNVVGTLTGLEVIVLLDAVDEPDAVGEFESLDGLDGLDKPDVV